MCCQSSCFRSLDFHFFVCLYVFPIFGSYILHLTFSSHFISNCPSPILFYSMSNFFNLPFTFASSLNISNPYFFVSSCFQSLCFHIFIFPMCSIFACSLSVYMILSDHMCQTIHRFQLCFGLFPSVHLFWSVHLFICSCLSNHVFQSVYSHFSLSNSILFIFIF